MVAIRETIDSIIQQREYKQEMKNDTTPVLEPIF